MVTSENPALHMAKEQPNEKSYRKPPFPCMAAVSTLKAPVRTITFTARIQGNHQG